MKNQIKLDDLHDLCLDIGFLERGSVPNKSIQTLNVPETTRLQWCPSGPGTNYPALKAILATCSGDAIRLWDAMTASCICTVDSGAYHIAFSADGKLLASATKTRSDKEMNIWSTRVRLLASFHPL